MTLVLLRNVVLVALAIGAIRDLRSDDGAPQKEPHRE
jgi:hypothetical protein